MNRSEIVSVRDYAPIQDLFRMWNIRHYLKLIEGAYHCDEFCLTMDRELNAAINIRNIGLIKVGHGMPRFTPVDGVTAAVLSRGGLRVATLDFWGLS